MDPAEAVIKLRDAAEHGQWYVIDTDMQRLSDVRPLRGTVQLNTNGTINFRYQRVGTDSTEEPITAATVLGVKNISQGQL